MNVVRRQSRTRISLLFILGLILLVVIARPHGKVCEPGEAGSSSGRLGGYLTTALTVVPCPGTGRVVYNARDNFGGQMDALDPIDDPSGGYLGVYHTPVRPAGGGALVYNVSLAHSTDLIHWTRVRVLTTDASMPSLAPIPGTAGYLLAYEQTARADFIRVVFYPSLQDLLAGHAAAGISLPRLFSAFSNGTPSFQSIDWRGGLARSVVRLAFHYEAGSAPGQSSPPDREATGTLTGFRTWSAAPDSSIDAALTRIGLLGNHGDQRDFSFAGSNWRVYEAQTQPGNFSTWHVLLYGVASREFEPLQLTLADGNFSTSFGNPIVNVVRAPSGHGDALVVTVFVFNTGAAASEAGELVYYQPLT